MIDVIHLNKKFGDKIVLDDFSISINDGEIVCIMGSSGCGKTTFINILLGLIKKDSGIINGISGKKISAVFQEDRLCPTFNAITNVKIVCENTISESVIINHLELLGLILLDIQQPISELSGGMQRRCSIVRAILAPSDIVIMDEPFKGLDNNTKNIAIKYIKEHINQRTLLMITHSENECISLGARIIKLSMK